jgi:Pyridoxamine 5'-phosphate oxidase
MVVMISFDQFRSVAPEIADRVLERFETTGLAMLGTIRRDGSPRVSPIEVGLHDGRLYVGMMPGSTKHLDVLRDPRVALVTSVADRNEVGGEGKLFARLAAVTDRAHADRILRAHAEAIDMDPDELIGSPMFEVLVEGAAWQAVDDDTWCTTSWREGEPVRHRRRVGAIGAVEDVAEAPSSPSAT